MSFEIEGNKLVRYIYEEGDETILIPEGVEIIGSGAFKFDWNNEPETLKEIVLPKSLLIIDESAFRCHTVERIVVQDGLKEIREWAFYCCESLKEIYLPETLEVIGECAFRNCRELEKVIVPSGIRVLSHGIFEDCWKLKEIVLQEGLTTIESCVFEGNKIQEIVIPASVTKILPGMFGMTFSLGAPKLTKITVDNANENYATGLEGAIYSKDMKTLIAVPNNFKEESFIIPDGVTTVESFAFCNNKNIRRVVVPSSVTEIGGGAFCECRHLYWVDLPDGIKTIESGTFRKCYFNQSHEFIIPETVENIKEYAFSECGYMEKIVIPNNVKTIGDWAFEGTDISTVILPISIEKIGNAFYHTKHLNRIEFVDNDSNIEKFDLTTLFIPKSCSKVIIPQRFLDTLHESLLSKETIDVYWTILKSDNPLEIASVMLYQGAKAWDKWVEGYGYMANEVVSKIIELFEVEEKISSSVAKKTTAFAIKYAKNIDGAILDKLIIELKSKGQKKLAETFENSAEIKYILSVDSVNPIEEYVNAHAGVGNPKVESVVKKGIKYADGSGVSSTKAVILIITQYMKQWSNYSGRMGEALSEGYRLQKDEIADHVASALDRKELIAFLEKQAYGTEYREYIIAFVRYAEEKQIQEFVKTINAKAKGKAKDRWWAQTAKEALYLSDCIAAAEYMDKNGMLIKYASMRGIRASVYRDTRMIEDFGFDDRGVISFDIGDSIVELSISEDAAIQLFDVSTQKFIKSFPKKSMYSKKLNKCEQQYKELKKRIEDFIAKRVEYFNMLYLNGQDITHDVWIKTYLTHPIIKVLARLLIWKDANRKLFVITENGPVDITNQPYSPVGDVKLAHILEMDNNEIESWRKFLADRKQKQLFAQVWEPLVSIDVKKLNKRYNGMIISNKERNDFKKAMKFRGIEVKSAAKEGEYNYKTGKYEFDNDGMMCIGDYAKLKYMVDETTKDLTLGNFIKNTANERVLNVLVYELDKVCMRARIAKDETEQIQIAQLDSYNLTQINEFINYATACKAIKCTAMLMDYKNKKYPDYDWLDSLVLEL